MNTQRSMLNTLRVSREIRIGYLLRNSPWTTTIVGEKLKGKSNRGKSRIPFMKRVMDDTEIFNIFQLL